jgi:hypothetical protein
MPGWATLLVGILLGIVILAVALRYLIPFLFTRGLMALFGMKASALKGARFDILSAEALPGMPEAMRRERAAADAAEDETADEDDDPEPPSAPAEARPDDDWSEEDDAEARAAFAAAGLDWDAEDADDDDGDEEAADSRPPWEAQPGGRWIRLRAEVGPNPDQQKSFRAWEPSELSLTVPPAKGKLRPADALDAGDAFQPVVAITALHNGTGWIEADARGRLPAAALGMDDEQAADADADADGMVNVDGWKIPSAARVQIDFYAPPGTRLVQAIYYTILLGHPIDISSMVPAAAPAARAEQDRA